MFATVRSQLAKLFKFVYQLVVGENCHNALQVKTDFNAGPMI